MQVSNPIKYENAHAGPAQLSPELIMKTGTGFWAAKTLMAALRFRLFTLLSGKKISGSEIQNNIHINERSLYDFLDALVALGFLQREGMKATALYSNTPETEFFLDRNKPSYIGGILEMCNNRLYEFWGHLEDALITGEPQNEQKLHPDKNMFETLYKDPERLKEFLHAMSGIQLGAFMAFAMKFNFSKYNSLCDAGGALGSLCIQVVMNQPHMKCISFDLPAVAPLATEHVLKHGLLGKVEIRTGNFFEQDIPKADVIVMGNILHDWDELQKLQLIRKAYDSLPEGGAFVCIEGIIDNERKQNAFGLLMSLNMLIETKGGFDFTFNDFCGWTNSVGFKKNELIWLAGPVSAAVAYK